MKDFDLDKMMAIQSHEIYSELFLNDINNLLVSRFPSLSISFKNLELNETKDEDLRKTRRREAESVFKTNILVRAISDDLNGLSRFLKDCTILSIKHRGRYNGINIAPVKAQPNFWGMEIFYVFESNDDI